MTEEPTTPQYAAAEPGLGRPPVVRSLPRSILPLLGAVLLCVLLVSGVGGVVLIRNDLVQHLARERADNEKVAAAAAQAVRQRVERTLEAITSLHRLGVQAFGWVGEAPRIGDPAILAHLKDWADTRRLGVLQVAFIDHRGLVLWTSVPGFDFNAMPLDLSDREHFRVHREGRLEPFVSVPLVGRASGAWSLQVTRPVLDQAGDFAGVVVISLDVAQLGRDLRELDFAAGATATLLRTDGSILSRNEDIERFVGERVPLAVLAEMADGIGGVFRVESSSAGQNSLTAWRFIPGWPLLVTFAMSEEQTLQGFAERQRILWSALLSALGVFAALGALALTWLSRQRARAQAQFAELSRTEVMALLEALPGVAYRGVLDAAGTYRSLYICSNVERMTGWHREAFDNSGFFSTLIAEDWGAGPRDAFNRRVCAVGEASSEYRTRTASGDVLWLRDHCRVAEAYSDGSVVVLGLLTDITAERQIRAQAIATAKLATLGEMATSLAHELNQPSATIALAADIAAAELDHGGEAQRRSARRRLEEIAVQTTRLRDVVDHFGIFGRTGSAENGPVCLAAAIRGAVAISGAMLKTAGIRAAVDVPEGLPLVCGELVALEQVLMNLMVNARDAMRGKDQPKRCIELTGRHDVDNKQVVLTVRDHGTGVPPAVLDRVFEPFYTTKPIGEGTGIGLSISYGTIRGFGGSIGIANHPDGGAIVTVRLMEAAPGAMPVSATTAPVNEGLLQGFSMHTAIPM